MLPPILQRVRVSGRQLDCYVARDSGYIAIAFISDAVDGRSAARERNTIVRQNDTFPQIPATLACGTSAVVHLAPILATRLAASLT